MNRRTFLTAIGLGPAAAKAAPQKVAVDDATMTIGDHLRCADAIRHWRENNRTSTTSTPFGYRKILMREAAHREAARKLLLEIPLPYRNNYIGADRI